MDARNSQGGLAGDGSQDCGSFFLDVLGPYSAEQLRLHWSEQARPTAPTVEQAIEESWQRGLGRAEKLGAPLWDGPLCRLIGYARRDDGLEMTLGPTSYRAFLGTNLHNAHLRHLHGPEVLANPLGVSANVIVGGEYILLGRRSAAVAYHAGRIHPVGGCVEPAPAGRLPDAFASLRAELQEELGAGDRQVGEVVCLGLVRDKNILQPELIFDVELDGSVDEIRGRMTTCGEVREHAELVVVRNHPANMVSFIEANYAALTPVALAGLLLHGLRCRGSGWFASTRGYLRSLI